MLILVHVRSECELQFVRFRPSRGGMAGPVKSYTEGTAFSIVDIRTLLGDPNHSHSEVNALGVTPVRNTTAIVSDETNVPRSCGSAQGDGWSGQYPVKYRTDTMQDSTATCAMDRDLQPFACDIVTIASHAVCHLRPTPTSESKRTILSEP